MVYVVIGSKRDQGDDLSFQRKVEGRGLQRNVIYLGWPIAPSYMSPNAGAGELRGLSHRERRVVTSAFWRTFSHEGKISLGWWGWGVHAHPLSLHLPSPVKLQCTLQLSGKIHWPCFISCKDIYSVVSAKEYSCTANEYRNPNILWRSIFNLW